MYMANAKILRWGPNATYIPLTGVGGCAHFTFCVGGNANFTFCVGSKIPTCWYTNMLVSPTQNSGVGGIAQRQPPTPYRLKVSLEKITIILTFNIISMQVGRNFSYFGLI